MINKKVFFVSCFLIILFSMFFISSSVSAVCIPDNPAGTTCLTNPLGPDTTPQTLIGRLISAVLGIVGSIALLMFVWGGFTWMTASGNAERVQKGKDILIWAAVGLLIIFSSYTMVNFVIKKMAGA